MTNGSSFGVSYALSSNTTDTTTTGVGGGAVTDPLNLDVDRGPAAEDRRHNLTANGNYNLPFGFLISGLFDYASGFPYNITNSTLNYVRPAPYDSLRQDDYVDLDMRAGKAFKFKRRYIAALFAEIFDLFNTNNFATYNGNVLSSGFGTPETKNPKRTAQFGFRFDY